MGDRRMWGTQLGPPSRYNLHRVLSRVVLRTSEHASAPMQGRRLSQIELDEFIADGGAGAPFDAVPDFIGRPCDRPLARIGDDGYLAGEGSNRANLVLSVDQLLERGWEFHLSKYPYCSREHPGKRRRLLRPAVLCTMNAGAPALIVSRRRNRSPRLMECKLGRFVTREHTG